MARGQISQSAGKGKKIAQFPFDVEQEADGRVVTRKVMIDAYMQNRYDEASDAPKAVIGTQFYLECEGEKEYGTDLDICLKAMRGKLDRKYKITWDKWFLVRVDPQKPYRGMGDGLSLSWTSIERGVTLDGDVLMREYDTSGDFRNPWKISPWPQAHTDRNGRTVACVLASPENEAALEAFAKKLIDLRKTLSDFVSPSNIEETLSMIAGGHLRLLGN